VNGDPVIVLLILTAGAALLMMFCVPWRTLPGRIHHGFHRASRGFWAWAHSDRCALCQDGELIPTQDTGWDDFILQHDELRERAS
jgi:hypothetical protein